MLFIEHTEICTEIIFAQGQELLPLHVLVPRLVRLLELVPEID